MSGLFPGGSSLDWLDLAVLGLLFFAMLAVGLRGAGRENKSGDFFTAGRRLSWGLACASLVASEVSALALLGLVASTYASDWSALRLFAAAAAARLCIAWLYLPIVYPASATTIYGYLDQRFGDATRRACAGFFIGMRLLASGARLAAAAAAAGVMIGCHPGVVIVVLALACAAYSSRGGLRAVSHAAAVQAAVILAVPLALLAYLSRHWSGGLSAALQAAHDAGRFGLGTPREALSLAPAFFASLASYGADQELAQNALAAGSLKDARRAMAWSVAASLAIAIAYLAVGTGLFAFYKLNPGMSPPRAPDLAFAHFCLTSLPVGVRGLAAAALVMAAAHLPLCSLSAAVVEDFYRPWLAPRKSEAHYLRVSKSAVWFFAAALSSLALLWNASEAWLAFLLKLGGMLLGPLLGVFLFALFSRRWADRANVVAAAAAAGVGAVAVSLIEADRLRLDPSWLVVSGALMTALLARQLAPYLDKDQ